jgi:hypothetical protein
MCTYVFVLYTDLRKLLLDIYPLTLYPNHPKSNPLYLLLTFNQLSFAKVSKKALAKQDNQVERAVRLIKEATKVDYDQDVIAIKAENERKGKGLDAYLDFKKKAAEKRLADRLAKGNIYIYMYVCMYIYVYLYVHVHIYMCVYICVYIYIYIHIYVCLIFYTYPRPYLHR